MRSRRKTTRHSSTSPAPIAVNHTTGLATVTISEMSPGAAPTHESSARSFGAWFSSGMHVLRNNVDGCVWLTHFHDRSAFELLSCRLSCWNIPDAVLVLEELPIAIGDRERAVVVVLAVRDVDVRLVGVHDPRRVHREVDAEREHRERQHGAEKRRPCPGLDRPAGVEPEERQHHGEEQEGRAPLHGQARSRARRRRRAGTNARAARSSDRAGRPA